MVPVENEDEKYRLYGYSPWIEIKSMRDDMMLIYDSASLVVLA